MGGVCDGSGEVVKMNSLEQLVLVDLHKKIRGGPREEASKNNLAIETSRGGHKEK